MASTRGHDIGPHPPIRASIASAALARMPEHRRDSKDTGGSLKPRGTMNQGNRTTLNAGRKTFTKSIANMVRTGVAAGKVEQEPEQFYEDLDWDDYIEHVDDEDFDEYTRFPVLSPSSPAFLIADVCGLTMVLFVAFWTPYQVAFVNRRHLAYALVDDLITFVFFLDMFMQFNTAFRHNNGVLERRRWVIAERYARSRFVLDLVATVPWTRLVGHTVLNARYRVPVAPMFRVLRLIWMPRLRHYLGKLATTLDVNQGFARLAYIAVLQLVITHTLGCIWYVIGKYDVSPADNGERPCLASFELIDDIVLAAGSTRCTWLELYEMRHGTNMEKYVAAVYWAFSTLTTVGYGDVKASTNNERRFAMVVMLTGVSWYAYIVSTTSSIMAGFEWDSNRIRERMLKVSGFLRENRLPDNLARQMTAFYTHFYSSNTWKMCSFDGSELLQVMPPALRCEVILYVECDLIGKIPFLDNKCIAFIADLVVMLQPCSVNAGEYIIREGTVANEMFFLTKGRAVVLAKGSKVHAFNEGAYFGEVGCIRGAVRTASIKAIMRSELQTLHKSNLLSLIEEYPDTRDELNITADARTADTERSSVSMPNGASEFKNRKGSVARPGLKRVNSTATSKPGTQIGNLTNESSSQLTRDIHDEIKGLIKSQLDSSRDEIVHLVRQVISTELDVDVGVEDTSFAAEEALAFGAA